MSGSKNEQSNWSTTTTNGSLNPGTATARNTKSSKKDHKKKKSNKGNKGKNSGSRSNDFVGVGAQFSTYDSSNAEQRRSTMADSDFF